MKYLIESIDYMYSMTVLELAVKLRFKWNLSKNECWNINEYLVSERLV